MLSVASDLRRIITQMEAGAGYSDYLQASCGAQQESDAMTAESGGLRNCPTPCTNRTSAPFPARNRPPLGLKCPILPGEGDGVTLVNRESLGSYSEPIPILKRISAVFAFRSKTSTCSTSMGLPAALERAFRMDW